jgi:hypothetical protein
VIAQAGAIEAAAPGRTRRAARRSVRPLHDHTGRIRFGSALVRYGAVLNAWKQPDPILNPRIGAARAGMGVLDQIQRP